MHEEERKRMVEKLVRCGYVHSKEVIEAMERVPRHIFLSEGVRDYAHSDTPLSIGEGQTISAPHMVGMMLELMELKKGYTVLEVGGGSGYHAALLGYMVGTEGHVYSVEIIESLARKAEQNIKAVGMSDRVSIILGDGSKGLKRFAPFDRITVACTAPNIPEPLVEQLKDQGILIIPVGVGYLADLIMVKKDKGKLIKQNCGGVAFVPMRGEYGI